MRAASSTVAAAALAALLTAPLPAATLEISGSLIGTAGYVALRDGPFYPDAGAVLPAYTACTSASLAAEAGQGSRLSFEVRCRADAVDGSLDLELLRAYAEARIGPLVSFGIGRRLVDFGCGLIWNPVNGIDAARDPFDREAARPGLDAAFATLDFGSAAGFPLSLALEVLPPAFQTGGDVSEVTIAAQAYAYVAGVELGLVGSCADPAGDRPRWSAGAWGTVDLAGLVLGIEAAWRKSDLLPRPDAGGLPVADDEPHLFALATASVRRGDFFFYAEGQYSQAGLSSAEAQRVSTAPAAVQPDYAYVARPGAIGTWHAAAGGEWSGDSVSFGFAALLDVQETAGALSATGSWAVDDLTVLKLRGLLPVRGREISEYDFLPFGWSAAVSVEVYF